MKPFLTIAGIFMSITALAQSFEIKSKTCNTSIALEQQIIDPRTQSVGPVNLIANWFVDGTGTRPSGFGKSVEKVKYDSIRSILNKGYKLNPVLSSGGDVSTAKPGDLFLLISTVCSADGASPFCTPVVSLSQAVQSASGVVYFKQVTSNSLRTVIEGTTSITAVYRAIQASNVLLPKCVLE
tara:strand:+ start:20478 stop:21023 length:546 start_codon:yes stop_codon:yes gene_type:complete